METGLGIHIGHGSVALAITNGEGEILAAAGPAPSLGDPLAALARLAAASEIDLTSADRGLATGIGAALAAKAFGVPEAGDAAAAVRAAMILAPAARSAIVLGPEDARFARVSMIGPADVRFVGPCGIGVGHLVMKWTQGETAEGPQTLRQSPADAAVVSVSCAEAADEDLERLVLDGAEHGIVAAAAARAAAAILARNLLTPGLLEESHAVGTIAPVALLGECARAPGLAAALAAELGLAPEDVIVPERAEAALAIGAALMARSVGRRPAFPGGGFGPASAREDEGAPAPDRADILPAAALARLAARAHADAALDVGRREAALVRIAGNGSLTDTERPGLCGRGLGEALEDVARGLGLAGARELGALAAGAERGAWLRDRCAGTIRADAMAAIASGGAPAEVARGALEAVARSLRRRLAGKWPYGDAAAPKRIALAGPLANVEGFTAALSRAFGAEVEAAAIEGAEGARDEAAAAEAAPATPVSMEPGPDGLAELESCLEDHVTRGRLALSVARMGLPLSLMDGARAVFWSRLLAELGFDVVLANRGGARFRVGCAGGAGEPCGPAAALRDEAAELVVLGAEAVFIPVEVDAPARQADGGARGVVYRCPFAQAGAHLVPPGSVRVVRPVRFGALPEALSFTSLVDSLVPWRIAPGAVRDALARAEAARDRYERDLAARAEAFMEALGERSRAAVVLGREYGARLLPGEARSALAGGGVAILPQEFLLAGLPADDEDALAASREMHWDSGRRILTAARKVARDGRLAAVYVTHARCGPDSFILKYAREVLAGRPWTRLEVAPDAASRPGERERLAERCRSFRAAWDARAASGGVSETKSFPDHPEPPRREGPPPLIRFPDMGAAADAGVAALAGFGIPAEVVRADAASLAAAARLTSGDECLPYIVTIGNMAKVVGQEGFDPARSAFFMATSSGSCRFGQYRRGFRQVLDALGHHDVRVISLNQSEGKTKQMPGAAFAKLLWKGMTALGALDEVALHVRPRAADPASADRAHAESREDVLACLRSRKDPREALARSGARFANVALDPGRLPVRIALTGEIFVRTQEFSNSGAAREIEAAGGEVVAPPFQEWLHHVSRCLWLFARARGAGRAQIMIRLVRWYLGRGEERARRELLRAGAPAPPGQPSLEEVWRASRAAGFVPWFGDASLALGRAIALGRRGVRGVVNLVPYGCLPGTTAEAVFAARRGALGGMPVLHLSLDGGPAAEVASRVRDLVEAARGWPGPPEPPPKPRARYVRPSIRRFWVKD